MHFILPLLLARPGLKTLSMPGCTVAGRVDRALFGQARLYCDSCATRTAACSADAPWGNAPRGPDARPAWCFVTAYDPEGALATVGTVPTVVLGLHFGRVLSADGLSDRGRLGHWCGLSLLLLAAGALLDWGGALVP